MQEWVLVAEWIAAGYVIILIACSSRLLTAETTRQKLFKGASYAVLVAIIVNLVSTYLLMLHAVVPIWIIEFIEVLYYIVLPFPSLISYYYVTSFVYDKSDEVVPSKSRIYAVLPYIIYSVVITLNYVFHNIFTVSVQDGYVRQGLYWLPYVLFAYYAICGVYLVCKKRKIVEKKTIEVIYKSFVLLLLLLAIQFFNPDIMLTGTIGCTTILIFHLYLQNSERTTDQLTGLLNRETLRHTLHRQIAGNIKFSLFVFSIRNFKGINERFGLNHGDKILKAVASYLGQVFPEATVYRYSGDEFAIIVQDTASDKESLLEQVFLKMQSGWKVENTKCFVNVVSARVDYPLFGEDARALISAMDYSIAKLKEKKGGAAFFHDATVCDEMRRKNDIISRLNDAIINDGIEVYYQPIYNSVSNNFTQAEALMRLKNNEVNPIYPNEFIPIAEEIGLIVSITYIILEKACADLRKIIDENNDQVTIKAFSVNFPYVQFLQWDMVDRVVAILSEYRISPDQIRIEITERTMVEDTYTIKKVIGRMQEKGFIFELDDFGIDYSNISLFLTLPINIIKIDRSLVMTAIESTPNKAFFEHLVGGIKALNTTIIVEGVEEKSVLDYVLDCGCDNVQGFFFSKPIPFSELLTYLLAYQSKQQS